MYDLQLHSGSKLKYIVRLLSSKGDRMTKMYSESITIKNYFENHFQFKRNAEGNMFSLLYLVSIKFEQISLKCPLII